MTIQRRRTGSPVTVYGRELRTDRRGNQQYVHDQTPVYQGHGWVIPDRSQRAEVVGQQEILVLRLGIPDSPAMWDGSTGLWTYVLYAGQVWDITQPPLYHHGTKRHTRHWSLWIRLRPEVIHG